MKKPKQIKAIAFIFTLLSIFSFFIYFDSNSAKAGILLPNFSIANASVPASMEEGKTINISFQIKNNSGINFDILQPAIYADSGQNNTSQLIAVSATASLPNNKNYTLLSNPGIDNYYPQYYPLNFCPSTTPCSVSANLPLSDGQTANIAATLRTNINSSVESNRSNQDIYISLFALGYSLTNNQWYEVPLDQDYDDIISVTALKTKSDVTQIDSATGQKSTLQAVIGSDNGIYTRKNYDIAPYTYWTSWAYSGAAASNVTLVNYNSATYEGVRGTDNGIYIRSTTNNGDSWSNWAYSGAMAGNMSLIVFNGKLVQAVRGTDNHIYTRNSTNGSTWSNWVDSGACASDVSLVVYGNKLIQGVRGTDNRIYTRYTFDGNNWSNWINSGAMSGNITFEVFNGKVYQGVRGTDNGIYLRNSTDGINWSNWSYGGALASDMSLESFAGRLFQAVRGTDNGIYTRFSTDGNNWTNWELSGSMTGNISLVGMPARGIIMESIRGTDNVVYTRASSNGTNWTGWAE